MVRVLLLLLLAVAMSSCSTTKYSYNKTQKRVERMTTPSKQYAFINNQIIIFENK
jgi:PBP1b-binding outer membrane lipoprotein LpoB